MLSLFSEDVTCARVVCVSCAGRVSVGESAGNTLEEIMRWMVGRLVKMGVLPELLTVRTCRIDAVAGVLG